jgi:aspartate aminotransferase
MRAEFGAENVYDLSLGNPHLDPPDEFRARVVELMQNPEPRQHGYMHNAGYPFVRDAVAEYLSGETGLSFHRRLVVMTVGAGGGLNIFLKTITEAGSRVVILAPYFAEYDFYIEAHGGLVETVQTDEDFQIDVGAVEAVMRPDVEAVIINSPNNPTGVVYPEEKLAELSGMLAAKEEEYGQEIYLISDEPYRRIVYDGVEVPWIFHHYRNSVVVTSHSKDLNLAGERIGYVALNPEISPVSDLFRGMVFTQRALGMVSAPGTMQRAVASLQGMSVDVSDYGRKRELLYRELTRMGYELTKPQGAFYFFPKAPGGDDVAFAKRLVEERILVVPGVGFGRPGYFRISYAVKDETVEKALDGFEKAIADMS